MHARERDVAAFLEVALVESPALRARARDFPAHVDLDAHRPGAHHFSHDAVRDALELADAEAL